MPVVITKKAPISFGVKVGAGVILSFLLIGIIFRLSSGDKSRQLAENLKTAENLNSAIYSISGKKLLVPVLVFSIGADEKEKIWTDQLATRLNGKSEVKVKFGRVDVLTDQYAIEVDFLRKWKEGLGQAIHYGDASNRVSVLAIIDNMRAKNTEEHSNLLKHIEKLCTEKGVKLIILKSSIKKLTSIWPPVKVVGRRVSSSIS